MSKRSSGIGKTAMLDEAKSRVKMGTVLPFNPLETQALGAAIAQVLSGTTLYKLTDPFPLEGAGIYAIYYNGNNHPYIALSQRNAERPERWPIYVGQALPAGARKGIKGEATTLKKKTPLKDRLAKHAASILEIEKSGGDLKIEDFEYRALVLNNIFIRLGEMSLLGIYAPVWNKFLDGFGNNPAGKERATTIRSQWDTVHPGRARAANHQNRKDFDPDLTRSEMKTYLDNFNLRDGFLQAEGQTAGLTMKINFAEAEELEANERTGSAQEDGS
jgi:hypothetical protein